MQPSMGRRLVAEAIGTAFLCFFGIGSIVADGALIGVALAHGLAIAIGVYAFGVISGAHFNPAVTLGLAVVGRVPWRDVGPYWAAQLVGGTVGAILVVAAAGTGAVDAGLGMPALAGEVNAAQGLVAEALGTFLLLTTIMAVAVDPRAPRGFAGLLIGLSISCAILAFGPLTGAAINPARTFGPYLAATLFAGDVPWGQLWVYLLGPFAGGALATLAYDFVTQARDVERLATTPAPGAAETPGAGGDAVD